MNNLLSKNTIIVGLVIVAFHIILGYPSGNLVIEASEIPEVPRVHTNITEENGQLVFTDSTGTKLPLFEKKGPYTLNQLRTNPTGGDSGVTFDFDNPELNGKVYFGLIEGPDKIRHSYPVYAASATITDGVTRINIIKELSGLYDFTGWQETGRIRLGYRILNHLGEMLYDGKLNVAGAGPFMVDTSIIEGPFINLVTHRSAVVSFETNYAAAARVIVNGRTFGDNTPVTHHEIALDDLQPNTEYSYTVTCGNYEDPYQFHTAPAPGSRLPFTFAYASDGRANYGGGERDIWGTNAYVLKRLGVAAMLKDARFIQFTGDLIDGFTSSPGEMMLEYANCKRAIEPFAHYLPFIAGCGNHELLMHQFGAKKPRARVDQFPFDSTSAEVVFARNVVNPRNGPKSEDNAVYDPGPERDDFPPYAETVFYYTYDNVAMVVLNSDYWYATTAFRAQTGGNPHGYVMDNQLAWLETTLVTLEADPDLDHVFVTIHTPLFPNGGHVEDDMWYEGNNAVRPVIAGKPVAVGIIERRDQLLDLLMNHSTKVHAVLTGDEHNYSLLCIDDHMPMYPEDWPHPKLQKIRPLWQINNGAAGAPYYGREETPWAAHVRSFSTQNALVLFHVDGRSVTCGVINPDTMEKLDEFEL